MKQKYFLINCDEQWILYNHMKCKRLQYKQNEPLLTLPKDLTSSKESYTMYLMTLEWSLVMSSKQKTKLLISRSTILN